MHGRWAARRQLKLILFRIPVSEMQGKLNELAKDLAAYAEKAENKLFVCK